MRLYNTTNDIKTELEILYKNVTGRPNLTAIETDIIYSSIVDAMQYVLLEYGVETFKFQEQTIEVDTTSGTNYIDLDTYVYKVLAGTVRITAEDHILSVIDETQVYAVDPDLSETGLPDTYSFLNSGTLNVMRLLLYPTPDAVYTVTLNVLQYPEDELTEFPSNLMSAIKNKTKELAVLGLGMPQLQSGFRNAYEDIIAKIKDGYNDNSPKHIGRTYLVSNTRSIEGRIP